MSPLRCLETVSSASMPCVYGPSSPRWWFKSFWDLIKGFYRVPSVSSVKVVFWWNLLLSLLEEAYYKLKKFEVLKLLFLRQQLEYNQLCVQPVVVLHELSLAESWMNVWHLENFMKSWQKCPDLSASQKLSWVFSHCFMEWWTLVFSLMQKCLTFSWLDTPWRICYDQLSHHLVSHFSLFTEMSSFIRSGVSCHSLGLTFVWALYWVVKVSTLLCVLGTLSQDCW